MNLIHLHSGFPYTCIPSASEIHISVSEGLRVSPATVDAVDIVNVKHSWPGSATLSDVIAMGVH